MRWRWQPWMHRFGWQPWELEELTPSMVKAALEYVTNNPSPF